ncbi:MFS transporter [Nonomuraea aurantiaca]|uniref:MFS transporter n=1 Tax=Nonomuraea aurantiaca TaxID=2878562 RepID=UPI001CDA12E3|nr:MFS transporter [Nonomuraea aurantiaca]MCA2227524.1 MFS transporter [Nonomuraea aurantiaca]
MALDPYKRLFRLPGVRTLLLVGLIARIPTTATGMALTLYVVNGLGLGFGQAGLVTMASTVGMAVGSPLTGRFVDKYGLRPVLTVTTVAQAAFWAGAWALPYAGLVVAAAVAGLLGQPVFSVIRQCLAAMVPVEHRRAGFSLDSMLVELAYMVGPALAVAGMTTLGSGPTLAAIAVGLTGSGVALIALNPPTRSAEELKAPAARVPRRQWLTPAFVALLGTVAAATFVLTATELALVGTMEHADQTPWIGLAVSIWCLYSLAGGFVYGGLSRGVSPLALIAGMGLLTVLASLAGGDWWWLMLALLPAGVLCAPSLSSTVDTVSRWVPAGARGEAMGFHGTALLIGGALSAPIAGAIIDAHGPAWAFVVAGLTGVAMVLVALPFWRRRPQPIAVPAEVAEPVVATSLPLRNESVAYRNKLAIR